MSHSCLRYLPKEQKKRLSYSYNNLLCTVWFTLGISNIIISIVDTYCSLQYCFLLHLHVAVNDLTGLGQWIWTGWLLPVLCISLKVFLCVYMLWSRLIANYITCAVGEVLLLILTICSLAAIFPRVSYNTFTLKCFVMFSLPCSHWLMATKHDCAPDVLSS